MNGFRLYLANDTVYEQTELCFVDKGNQAFQNLIHSVDCDLSPTKNVYFFNRFTYVEICYIEIYGKVLTKHIFLDSHGRTVLVTFKKSYDFICINTNC